MKDFINWLTKKGYEYKYEDMYGVKCVYVYGPKQKRIGLSLSGIDYYKPYIRISNFESNELYVRNNGIVYYDCIDNIKNYIVNMCEKGA